METIARYLNGGGLERSATMDETRRGETLAAFLTRSAGEYEQELLWLGEEYERIRIRLRPGDDRTQLIADLVRRAQVLAGERDAALVGEKLFARGTEGARVIGLALAERDPQRQHLEMALSGIREMRSPFEQYNALLLAEGLTASLPLSGAAELQATIESQLERTINKRDPSRWRRAQGLVSKLSGSSEWSSAWSPPQRRGRTRSRLGERATPS
jgi:hypothetical protein